jgi:hypothetical protein
LSLSLSVSVSVGLDVSLSIGIDVTLSVGVNMGLSLGLRVDLDPFLYLNVSINPDPDQDPSLAMPASLVMRITQRSQQLVTLLSLTVTHPLGKKGFLLTGKINFPGPRVEVV